MKLAFDEATARHAIAGNTQALKLLLTLARPQLRQYVERRIPIELRNAIESDDIVQEAYINVFRGLESFRPDGPAALERWLMTVLVNRLRDAKRSARAMRRRARLAGTVAPQIDDSAVLLIETLAGPTKTPSSHAARAEACLSLQRAIRALPSDYQQAVWMVYIEGRPIGDVAQALSRTPRAIHGLCRRGLARLHADLGSRSGFLGS